MRFQSPNAQKSFAARAQARTALGARFPSWILGREKVGREEKAKKNGKREGCEERRGGWCDLGRMLVPGAERDIRITPLLYNYKRTLEWATILRP